MPLPEGLITVGIDGGYVRSQEKKQPHFEVMVAKSMPVDKPKRYLGLVQSHDSRPKRRLHEVLKEQGWQENQPVTFLTDGGDTVRNMAPYMAPASEHLLDWFHITRRITVMRQYVRGLSHQNPDAGQAVDRRLRQIKGYLWNGNLHDGRRAITGLVMDLEDIETDYPGIKALRKAADEFEVYIRSNAGMIPNYAERRRYGERVPTMPSGGATASAFPPGLWRVPSTRLSASALASVSKCSGRKAGRISCCRPGREPLTAHCGGSSSSGTQD